MNFKRRRPKAKGRSACYTPALEIRNPWEFNA
jgi:hypothetical protein